MRSRALITACALALLPATALANGRPPGTSTINFRKGMEQEVFAGMTFGALLSKDNGATWYWICEDAIGYGGMYDPDYVFAPDGTLFATTFDGLKANRDGCVWGATPHGIKFVSTVTQGHGADNALLVAVAQAENPAINEPGDSRIYRSTDGGATFPTSAMPGQVGDWWQSLEIAPSDPDRVYLFGYRFVPGEPKVSLLFRSDDAGATFTALPVTDFTVMANSTIELAGISKTNPDLLFARVTLEDNNVADGLYRSTNAGQSWTKILTKDAALSFLVRANGDLVAGTQALGAWKSTNNGDTWEDLPNPPHINCLSENSAGEVWACTQNYMAPPDGDLFGIMKSTDLATWTGVLRYQDIVGPVACPADTVQEMRCNDPNPRGGFCALCLQLGCDAKRDCSLTDVAEAIPPKPKKPGCCSDDAGGGEPMAMAIMVGFVVVRPRRRRVSE